MKSLHCNYFFAGTQDSSAQALFEGCDPYQVVALRLADALSLLVTALVTGLVAAAGNLQLPAGQLALASVATVVDSADVSPAQQGALQQSWTRRNPLPPGTLPTDTSPWTAFTR